MPTACILPLFPSYININVKHIQISHKNQKIYCHFYNNNETCPFDEECVFLHEDADMCRYGAKCEREYCMFKHEHLEDVDIVESLIAKDSIWNVVDESEIVDDETTNKDVDNLEMTFQNPSPTQEINVEKETEETSPALAICELCNVETAIKERMKRHTFEIHLVKGKYVCIQCKYEFETRKQFNSHNYHGCG